eukprot:544500-Alexandrium_andersonii.AAC.1
MCIRDRRSALGGGRGRCAEHEDSEVVVDARDDRDGEHVLVRGQRPLVGGAGDVSAEEADLTRAKAPERLLS